jgi:hypothetical protein
MKPRGCNRWRPVANRAAAKRRHQAKAVAVVAIGSGKERMVRGRVDATSLSLKGVLSWLRKERSTAANPGPAGLGSNLAAG